MGLPEIKELLLDENEDRKVTTLLRLLHGLESVTDVIQNLCRTLADAHVLFEGVVEKHPITQVRLKATGCA